MVKQSQNMHKSVHACLGIRMVVRARQNNEGTTYLYLFKAEHRKVGHEWEHGYIKNYVGYKGISKNVSLILVPKSIKEWCYSVVGEEAQRK